MHPVISQHDGHGSTVPTSPNPQPEPLPRLHVLHDVVMDFSPAYFAMVMATGIVSLSTQMLGMPRLSFALFRLNSRESGMASRKFAFS